MKTVVAVIISSIIVISVCIGLYQVASKPSEIVGYSATVKSVESVDGEYRYSVVVDNGHIWTLYNQEQYSQGDRLIVVFYTFESRQCDNWDVLDMWKV